MHLSTGKQWIPVAGAHMVAVLGLVLIAFLTVYRSFSEFGFYYDDWRFLQEASQLGSVETVFPTRPLHRPLTEWVFNTVAFNPTTGYVMLAALLIASGLAMYWVMNVIFPRRRALAVITTALYLLYPGDLSRTWITAGLTANRPAVLLALVSLGLLFTALRARKHHIRTYRVLTVASVGIYVASLMLYEAQALLVPALAFAGAIWMGMSGRGLAHRSAARTNLRNAVVVTAPFVAVFAAVLAWRFALVQGGADDRFTSTANFSPLYVTRQLVGVYYFNFLEQPIEVIVSAVPFLSQMRIAILLLALFGAALVVTPVIFFTRRISVASPPAVSFGQPPLTGEPQFYRNLLITSLVLTGVVYLVLLPHDHIISAGGLKGPFVSRLNAAGAVVVAMAAGATIMFAWTWAMTRWRNQRFRVSVAVAGGLSAVILLLVSFHGIVQRDYADAWQLQQEYAQQVFDAVPDVSPGTHFHFHGVPSRQGASYVFMYSLEHMLRLAYDDESITATSTSDDDGGYAVTRDGLHFDGELVAPADRVWHFTLVPGKCEHGTQIGCGHLVISAPYLAGQGSFVNSFSRGSDELSPAAKLLGIQPLEPRREDLPQFAAPNDPTLEQPEN